MDTIKKLFPLSFGKNTVKDLVIAILIYIVLDIVCGFVIGLLGKLPLIGWLFGLVGAVAGIYFFVGIVIAVLAYLKVLKD